jgi:uncharacterized membrane protein
MLISAILLISVDSIYLNLIKTFFEKQIQRVQDSQLKINFLGAALCYVFLIIGINYFIIIPRKSVSEAFLFGLIIYGVFETTNYALLKNWSIFTVLIDTIWGGTLFAITTYLVNLLRIIF